jgi:UDP-N-acetylglucosamine transferase subunit ALG13
MILITVGTAPFPFYRMNNVFKSLLKKRKNQELIIYQHGATRAVNTDVPKVIAKPFFPYGQLQRYMKEARIIIAHGGLATIYQAIQANNKPYILARRKEFHEHVNNHQVHFTEYLTQEKLIYPLSQDGAIDFSRSSYKQSSKLFSATTKRLCGFLDNIIRNDK